MSYYFVLIFFVGPIWAIVPAAWAFFLYTMARPNQALISTNGRVLFAMALCEVSIALLQH